MLALVAVFSMGVSVTARAEEKTETENVLAEEIQWPRGCKGTAKEMTDQVLKELAEKDEEKAKELAKLREENPKKFRDEFRKVMRDMFGKDSGERKGHGLGRQRNRDDRPGDGKGANGRKSRQMEKRYEEYLKWFEKDYPEEANKLSELRGKNPELHRRHLRLSMKKYGRIARTAEENPVLAKVLKENLKLNEERDSLLQQLRKISDEEKTELVKELKDVLNKKFDLIVKRKQLEYEQLAEKLEELKKEIKASEEKVEKWNDPDFKNKNVEARLEKLLSKQESFEWE